MGVLIQQMLAVGDWLSLDMPVGITVFFDSDGGPGLFLALILLAGPAFYVAHFVRYRNQDKRHFHEHETRAELANFRQYDTFVKKLKKQDAKLIKGANHMRLEGSLVPETKGLLKKMGMLPEEHFKGKKPNMPVQKAKYR